MSNVKSEASVLARLKAWRELFGAPFDGGRNNPDNDIWFLMLDAEETIEGLQRYARSLERSLSDRAAFKGGQQCQMMPR